MLYCMEYLEENQDWLDKRLDALGSEAYVVFDLPGQVEISTNHSSLRTVLDRFQKRDWRVGVVEQSGSHLADLGSSLRLTACCCPSD
jgi:GPN-loop GTPase